MRGITSEELAVIVDELQEFAGFYIDKFYEVADDRFRLKMSKNKVQANIQIILSHAINRTEYIEKQDMPTNFASAVRKRIEGFQIREIRQLNYDRVVVFVLGKGEATLNMIVEMFGKGNLIITDENMRILLAQKVQESRDRNIKNGFDYKPPTQATNYRFEKPAGIKPIIYRSGGKAVDYSIRELEKYAGLEAQGFGTLQEALDQFYFENPIGAGKEENTEQKRRIEELENSIKKQEKLLGNFDREIEDNKEMGRTLLEKMNSINALIGSARADRRITREGLQRQFPDVKILNVDLKNKKVRIEIG